MFYVMLCEIGKCLGVVATFEGRLGVFIDGQIHPPLEGVIITIYNGEGVKVRELLSDENGNYRYVTMFLITVVLLLFHFLFYQCALLSCILMILLVKLSFIVVENYDLTFYIN